MFSNALRILTVFYLHLAMVCWVSAQGPLNPRLGPAPSMKTLDQLNANIDATQAALNALNTRIDALDSALTSIESKAEKEFLKGIGIT